MASMSWEHQAQAEWDRQDREAAREEFIADLYALPEYGSTQQTVGDDEPPRGTWEA